MEHCRECDGFSYLILKLRILILFFQGITLDAALAEAVRGISKNMASRISSNQQYAVDEGINGNSATMDVDNQHR